MKTRRHCQWLVTAALLGAITFMTGCLAIKVGDKCPHAKELESKTQTEQSAPGATVPE